MRLILLSYAPFLIFSIAIAPLILAVCFTLFVFCSEILLDPNLFWLTLPLMIVTWCYCQFNPNRFLKVIAKTLRPWLFGMIIVGAIFIAAREWLPRAQWSSIFWLENAASWCEVTLHKLSPYPLPVNVSLLVVLFTVNVYYPAWRPWTRRFEKGMSIAKACVGVLAVFTSFTFFGSGQASVILEKTAEEKYARLKEQADARADLILAARLSENTEEEARNTKEFLDAVYLQVSIDWKMPLRLDDDYVRIPMDKQGQEKWFRSRLEGLVKDRVSELVNALAKSNAVGRMKQTIDGPRLSAMLDHSFTSDEIKEAKERFLKSLDIFVDKGADLTFHPLAEFLTAQGLPQLVQAAVNDLYASQVTHLSKEVTEPLADLLFRTEFAPGKASFETFSKISERLVFDTAALPREIVAPTVEQRRSAKMDREIVAKSAREAIREGR